MDPPGAARAGIMLDEGAGTTDEVPAPMPVWTLRLVTCAGVVALLGRLPATDSVNDAFAIGLVGFACIAAALYGGRALRTGLPRLRALFIPRPGATALRLGSLRPPHGADA